MAEASEIVIGADPVIAHYGYWPSFHDAEMFTILIDRQGPTVTIHFLLNDLINDKHNQYADVTLRWHEVEELSLDGIDEQNWAYHLKISRNGEWIDTEIVPNDGTGGTIRARRVEVTDFKPIAEGKRT